jgi:hypothetical protein
MKPVIGPKTLQRLPVKKRTSQGRKHAPKNKSKRRSFKPYRGQG